MYANETNPLVDHDRYYSVDRSLEVDLADRRLARVTRLRLLTDPGCPFFDLSYCHGELRDGTPVRVRLPRHQFPKRGLSRSIVQMAIDEGVHAKRLGMLDAISTLR